MPGYISTILQNLIYILPVEIFDKRRKQGVRRVDRRKSKQTRRAEYGLEIPCVYRLYGPKAYVDRIKEISDSTMTSGLIAERISAGFIIGDLFS